MPRGFRLDVTETKAAYACGALTDKKKRSFIGRKPDGTLHLMLFGEDKTRMHDEIMSRDRCICRGCPKPHYVGPFGEWDHLRHQLWNRCDDAANGRCVCSGFHVKRHGPQSWKLPKEKFEPCVGVKSFVGREVAA